LVKLGAGARATYVAISKRPMNVRTLVSVMSRKLEEEKKVCGSSM